MKLTAIICVYNTERQYFEECLKSIRNSTLKDYEILVIDDGSDLDYSDLVKKYEVRYVKTENRGLFASRLYALSLASGEYITFVDSDDTVSFNYHMPMLEKAMALNCDVVINDWAFHTERTRYFCVNDPLISCDIALKDDEILKEFASQEGRAHSYFVHWNKVTKKSLLLKAKSELEKTDVIMHRHTYSEDALINFFVFKNAKKVANIHTGYYFYRVHNDQSVNASSKDKLIMQIDNMAQTFDIMLDSIGDNKHAGEIKESIEKWRALMSRTHYSYAKANKHPDLYPYIKEKYQVSELKTSTRKDGELYAKNQLLGDNFLDIDKALRKIYFTNSNVTVIYDKTDKYVSSTMSYIERMKHSVTETERKTLMVPKKVISAKNRFLHNHLVYTMGMIFFKKGSKIRAFLKSKF